MTTRDRTVLGVAAMIGALLAFWFLAIAPKRDEAATLETKITDVRGQLDTVRAGLLVAEQARAQYDEDYATVARLGKAVPADDEVPSLLVQLETAAKKSGVDFRVIRLEASGAPAAVLPAPAATAAAIEDTEAAANGEEAPEGAAPPANAAPAEGVVATLPPGATVGPAGFPTMPFSFTFHGSFRKLEDFLGRVRKFTEVDGDEIDVRGRLLTIDAVSLQAGPKGFPQLVAEIKATAYLQPPGSAAAPTSAAAAEQSATTAPTGATP